MKKCVNIYGQIMNDILILNVCFCKIENWLVFDKPQEAEQHIINFSTWCSSSISSLIPFLHVFIVGWELHHLDRIRRDVISRIINDRKVKVSGKSLRHKNGKFGNYQFLRYCFSDVQHKVEWDYYRSTSTFNIFWTSWDSCRNIVVNSIWHYRYTLSIHAYEDIDEFRVELVEQLKINRNEIWSNLWHKKEQQRPLSRCSPFVPIKNYSTFFPGL